MSSSSFGPPPLTRSGFESVSRRHSRKKSSQILVEPSGMPANYVPMSPSLAVPHGLESALLPPTASTESKPVVSSSSTSSSFAPASVKFPSLPDRRNQVSEQYSSKTYSSDPYSPDPYSSKKYSPEKYSSETYSSDPYSSMPATPTHHSQPQLVIPTPRNPARAGSLRVPGHGRAASMHVDFGRSKSMHTHNVKYQPPPSAHSSSTHHHHLHNPVHNPTHHSSSHPPLPPIPALPTELKIDTGRANNLMDSPPKTPTYIQTSNSSSQLRKRARSSSSVTPVHTSVPAIPNHISSSTSSNNVNINTSNSSNQYNLSKSPSSTPLHSTSSGPSSQSDPSSSSSGPSSVSSSVLFGASSLIAGQLASKLLTFILNQVILRLVGPNVFGAASQLELLVNTVLFFAREAGRLATQRQTLTGKRADVYRFEGGVVANTVSGTAQEVVNMGFVSVVVGLPLSVVLGGLYYKFNALSSNALAAVTISVAAAVIELFSEPCFLLFQLQLKFGQRASFESVAVAFRCVITLLLTLMSSRLSKSNHASSATSSYLVISFAMGQLAYSSALAAMYIYSGIQEARSGQYDTLFPRPVWHQESTLDMKSYLNSDTRVLARSIWLQTIFKHCLSEGDKFLISWLLPMADQGVYAVVGNYGSLVARLVFFPIEETLRNIFSKIMSLEKPDFAHSITVLSTLLRFYIYLALFAVTFAPVVAGYLLSFLVSNVWLETDAPVVFAAYAGYIPFLAINGALEAFVQSVATPDQIRRQASVMAIFSATFALAAYVLMKPSNLGATGLVFANMFNMAQRIGWCIMWIETYYQKHTGTGEKGKDLNDSTADEKKEKKKNGKSKDINDNTKKWKWLLLSVPSPVVLVPSILAMAAAWFGIGHVDTFRKMIYQVMLAIVLMGFVGIAERSLVMQGVGMVIKRHSKASEKYQDEKKRKVKPGKDSKEVGDLKDSKEPKFDENKLNKKGLVVNTNEKGSKTFDTDRSKEKKH